MAGASELRSDRAPARDEDDLDSLRTLIVGPEQEQLALLQARLDDSNARADAVAEILPQVLLEHADDPRFARALTPPLEKAITTSVQRNPQPLSDALFPVMGPAIRKAVAAALAGMIESLNRTLDHAFSLRSIQWRLEALRTRKSFGEIVLLKTLLFRVEQVFLIDRKSGLLLQHVWAEAVEARDADMVAGMLTAIKDFAQDSFRVSAGESLEAVKVGDLSVLIEPGPRAVVAAVVRGTAPAEYRRTLQEAVETLHLQFGDELADFRGETAVFADAKGSLEGCLRSEFRADEKKPRTRAAWIAGGIALALLAAGIFFYVRAGNRWQSYLSALRAEPGLVILSADRGWFTHSLSGLRDPLARDPKTLLAAAGLAEDDVQATWTPYYALESSIAAARAANATAGLDALAQETILAIQGERLLFVRGSVRLAPGQGAVVARLATSFAVLDRLAAAAGARYSIEIVGHTDSDGPDEANIQLSEARAAAAQAAVAPQAAAGGESRLAWATRGQGSRQPAVSSENEQGKQQNRRVMFSVARVGK
jgi:OOP family OmpA-OmpF porin